MQATRRPSTQPLPQPSPIKTKCTPPSDAALLSAALIKLPIAVTYRADFPENSHSRCLHLSPGFDATGFLSCRPAVGRSGGPADKIRAPPSLRSPLSPVRRRIYFVHRVYALDRKEVPVDQNRIISRSKTINLPGVATMAQRSQYLPAYLPKSRSHFSAGLSRCCRMIWFADEEMRAGRDG